MKKNEKKIDSEEPELKHYLIVIGIFILIGFGVWGIFKTTEYLELQDKILNIENRYTYPYLYNNNSYNIEFYSPFVDIEKRDFQININKLELLNTNSFRLSHLNYSESEKQNDTGYTVGKTSSRFLLFMAYLYDFKFDETNIGFVVDNLNCSNSTIENKVVIFNSKANLTEINYNKENGCIEFLSKNSEEMVYLGDAFFYNLIKE